MTHPSMEPTFDRSVLLVRLEAAWATDRALVRRTFCSWFQPHYP